MTSESKTALDFEAIAAKLKRDGARRLWRSMEEVACTPEYEAFLNDEFPNDPEKEPNPARNGLNRREVLKLMAASAALSGLTACTKLPTEKIVPYVRAPEEVIPGKPLFYATSMMDRGVGIGLLVESHMGRPTKVEGNPEHPGSLGSSNIFCQASVLSLWDPDRSQVILREGRISDWPAFLAIANELRGNFSEFKRRGTANSYRNDLVADFRGADAIPARAIPKCKMVYARTLRQLRGTAGSAAGLWPQCEFRIPIR